MSAPHDEPVAQGSARDTASHTIEHRVRFDECDAAGALRPSGWLRLMQDLAWQHSDALGMDRAWYAGSGLTWLVRAVDLGIRRPVRSGETVRLTTQVTGWRRVWARRRTEGVEVGGERGSSGAPGAGGEPASGSEPGSGSAPAAVATIDWVLIDARGRPVRIPSAVTDGFLAEAPSFDPERVLLPMPPEDAVVTTWRVGIRDLDPLRHVNNAAYLDIIDSALAEDGDLAGPQPPLRYRVEYLRPATAHQDVSVVRWVVGDDTAFRLLGPDGAELLRALVTGR